MLAKNEDVKSPLQFHTMEVYQFPSGTLKCGKEVQKSTVDTYVQQDDNTRTVATRVACNVTRILHTSDNTPGECTISVPDPKTSVFQDSETEALNIPIGYPAVGDEIAVFSSSVSQDENATDVDKLIFKGYVSDISHSIGEGGSNILLSCVDMKARLMDESITKTYNTGVDLASRPNFSEKDRYETPLHDGKWTVGEILADIFSVAENQRTTIAERFKPLIYFSVESLVYDTVPELEDFIPSTIDFDNEKILDAIFSVIKKAGPYRMVYDPNTDKLVFTKITKLAKKCGDEIVLTYASSGKEGEAEDEDKINKDYAQDVNVITDNTTRKISEMANIYRMIMSNKIQWYTGHYYIAKYHRAMSELNLDDTYNEECIYFNNNYNWDGYEYFFGPMNVSFVGEGGADEYNPYIIVGCPLYPQWNPMDGYKPYQVHMTADNTRKIANDWAPQGDEKITDDKYDWNPPESQEFVAENEGITMLDKAFPTDNAFSAVSGDNDFAVALGHTYEAWFPWPGKCLHCGGTGAVANDGNDASVNAWVENYETWFGNSRESDGTMSKEVVQMTPFDYSFKQVTNKNGTKEWLPQKHPLPWLNTCLACRGTGYEPMFKIKNLQEKLIEVPPDKAAMSEEAVKTKVDRTWGQMVRDYTDSYNLQVQVETTFISPASPALKFSDAGAVKHPLAGTKCNIFSKEDSDRRKIYPDDEKVRALYKTQVTLAPEYDVDALRGNIIFRRRQAVVCEKKLCSIKSHYYVDGNENKKYRLIYTYGAGDNQETVTAYDRFSYNFRQTSYWRAARAWITCYFTREKFYDDLKEATNNPRYINLKYEQDEASAEDDTSGKYEVAARIWDGMAVMEVKEVYSKEDKSEFSARPIVRSESTGGLIWQICPYDIGKMPVPDTDENAWLPYSPEGEYLETILAKMIEAKYWFPEAAITVSEPFTQDEVNKATMWVENPPESGKFESRKLKPEDVNRENPQPKLKKCNQADERYTMIVKACEELDRRNDIAVTGSVSIRGTNIDLSKGMGYVKLADGYAACVVKIEHSIGNGFVTTVELGTEELRLGETLEEDKDYKRRIMEKVNAVYNKAFRQKTIPGGAAPSLPAAKVTVEGNDGIVKS